MRGLGSIKLEMYENSISGIRKMFTERNTRYSQWFRVRGQEVPVNNDDRISTYGTHSFTHPNLQHLRPPERVPHREYIIRWNTLNPLSPSEVVGWITNPRLLSFDIETYSDNHNALPNMFNSKHLAYLNSCVYQRLGDLDSRRRFMFIVGDCNDVPGVEIIRCKDEVEMVECMGDLVRCLDPEIITGYNILSYDYPYLDVRLKTKMRDWPTMGRLEGRNPKMITKTWESSAYAVSYTHLRAHET